MVFYFKALSLEILFKGSNRLSLVLDAVHPNDSPEHINLGLEYALYERFFLRSGYRFNYDEENISFGAGLRINLKTMGNAIINYAVMPLGPFGKTSQISIELGLN